jgi:hypothetical protein
MEAIRSSETSGTTQRTTRRYIPEEDTLNFSWSIKKTPPFTKPEDLLLCAQEPAANLYTEPD